MRLIFRYLAKETYTTMFAVTSILVVIFVSHQFVHYLADAAGGRLTSQAVLQIMCIQIPLLLGFLIPLGFFLGILLSYGRFYVDNEMTILTACGVSNTQLLMKSLVLSAFTTLLVAILMIWVEPKMAWYRDRIITKAVASPPMEKISAGRFQQVGNWILYTEGLTRDRQKMTNVFAAYLPSPESVNQLNTVVFAERAFETISAQKETFIVLSNGRRYQGIPGKKNYQITQFSEYGVRLPNHEMPMRKVEKYMSLEDLWHSNTPRAAAEFQWRLSMPISVLLLTLLAVPLSEVKPRQGRFAQMLPALIIYIVYLDLLFLGRVWIEKSRIPAYLGLWWIHGLMLIVSLFILSIKFYRKVK